MRIFQANPNAGVQRFLTAKKESPGLASIKTPILVVDGDHDEAIKREHTEYIAATIPGAGLLLLPNTSHFAFLQDPALFNAALLDFLDSK